MLIRTYLLRTAGLAAVLFLVSSLSPTSAQIRGVGGSVYPREPKSVTESRERQMGGARTSQPKYLSTNNTNVSAEQAIKYGDMARQANPPNYEVAMMWYQRALTKDPNEARAYVGFGKIYDDQLRYDEARAAYQRAIAIKPTSVEAHVAFGYSMTNQELFDEAIESFNKAVALDPKSVEAHLGIADMLFAQRRFTEAVEAYRKTIELKPKSLEANYSLGVTYVMLNNREAATAQVNVLKSLNKPIASKLETMIMTTRFEK